MEEAEVVVAILNAEIGGDTIPLPPDCGSSHRQTVESPETRHLAGVVQW